MLQPEGAQVFVEGCEIYTDGSAVQTRFKPIAHAACAAVQWDTEGVFRCLKYQVPRDWPQSAVCSEFLAFKKVADHLATHKIKGATVVTDCQAVQTLFYNSEMMGYKVKFAGAWKGPELNSVTKVEKVKAHLTLQEAAERGQEQWWDGNHRADICANAARASTTNSSEWLKQFKAKSATIVQIATRLAMMMPTHPPDSTDADKAIRASIRAEKAAEGRSMRGSKAKKRSKPPWEFVTVKN